MVCIVDLYSLSIQNELFHHMFVQKFLTLITILKAILQCKLVSILQYGGVDSQRMNCTWYKRYFPFQFHSPLPPSQRPYTTIISIIFRSNGNAIPLFFIFIFFLSLQITPRCVFICFNPLHLSLLLLFCIFFYLFQFLPSVSFYLHNHHHFP